MVALKKYGMLLFAMVWLPALLLTAADLQGKNLQDSVTVGLALSGGGARGLAHVGVLMALEEEGIPIDMIAGSSMGSIVGGLYAAGYSGEQQQAVLKKINWEQIFREEPETESQWLSKRYGIYPPVLRLRFDFWKIHVPSGLSNAQRISEEFFELTAAADYWAGMNFDSLRVPYRAVAVDLMSGKEIVVDHGSLAQTMRASMSVPLFFQPAELDGRVYVDGGVLNNLPTDVLSNMGADVIIASDVVHVEHLEAKPAHLIEVADRTIDIMSNAMTEKQLDLANVTITPEVQDFHSTQFSRYDSLVVLGYHAAKEQIDTIKQVLRSRHGDRIITRHSLPPGALNSAILGTIQLHGTDYVREAVIRSEIQVSPGDTFSTEKAVNSIQNIYATGLFEYVWAQVSHPGDNQVDMHFHVKEKYPRTINFGTNYISDHGVSGFVQIVHFNFLGWGERFMPILRLGKTKRKLGIEVYNDRLFSTPVTLNNAIYYKEENPYLYSTDGTVETQITLERTAAQFGLGAQFRKNSLITLGIQRERVWIQDAGRYFSGSRTDDFVNLYGKIIFDSTNDPHLPTQGTSLQLEVSHTETIDERVSRYYRAKGILKRYWKFSGKWSASGKVKVAATENSAPFYQYFRIGGPQDLPGFHRDELWGSSLVALGLHPRYKVTGTLYLEANFMAGNIYNSLTQVTMRNLIPAVSAGVRISLPVGPIQLHYGYNDLGRGIWYSSAGFHF